MNKIKVVFDDKSKSILDLFSQCRDHELIEYDTSYSNEKKKGSMLMRKYSALTTPFVVFENKKRIDYKMIWIGDTDHYPTIDEINEILNEGN